MNLSSLPKIGKRKKKRVGRGYGSGKGGHTVGRGQKGQKSRSGGGPKKERMYGKPKTFSPPKRKEPEILDVSRLNAFADGSVVSPQVLVEKGFVRKITRDGVKLLGRGELEKKLMIKDVAVSAGARVKIEGAGGSIE